MADLFHEILAAFDKAGLWDDGNAVQLRFLDMLLDKPLVVKEGKISVRVANPMNFCLHKLIIGQRRLKADKAAKDIEQGVHMLLILKPADFQREVQKLPKKWKQLIQKSLMKARTLIPSEIETLDRFEIKNPK